MADIPVTSLTEATLEGSGVFDVLMRANKAHLEAEFAKNRIKGPEYSTVYLGSLQTVLQYAVAFLLQKDKSAAEIAEIEARTALLQQQKLNAEVELLVLQAQKCKLDAEYDLLLQQKLKVAEETGLLAQKKVTEQAQTANVGSADSVIGRQKALYMAQADGFKRDAEQKAADIMVKSWGVRRTTDEGTSANTTNRLDDSSIGQAVNKLLQGVGA